jgi:4-alpha-glucanotransferase
LPGELDVNFRIDAASGAQFFPTIHSPDTGPEILDLQNKALAHLQRVAPELDLHCVVSTRTSPAPGTPMQDMLMLGAEHRMNTPATTKGNWRWRFRWEQVPDDLPDRLHHLVNIYGRA